MTPDLKRSNVFISLSKELDEKEILQELKLIAPKVRKIITDKLQIRTSPELRFSVDKKYEEFDKIQTMLDGIAAKRNTKNCD